MKKAVTLFLFLLCFSIQDICAQLEVVGSKEFGRIFDLIYDLSVPNKIYGVTLGNHIIVSEDNGDTWEILYSLILGQGAAVKDLKLSADGRALTFSAWLPNSQLNAIMIYDIASATIIKTFPLPNQRDFAYVTSYDFYDDNMDVLLVDTSFPVGLSTEGKAYYTATGGNSWNMIYHTNDNETVFLNEVAISPNNPNKIFLTRSFGRLDVVGGVFVSNDAGQTFIEKLPGIILDPISFDPSNDQTILIGTGISFGVTAENLYRSTDGGDTFSIVPIAWTEGILDCINVIKYNENNPSKLIILEENEIAISEDGGATFQITVYPDIDDSENYYYGLNANYNPQNSNEIVISSNYIPFFSNDRGSTLNSIKSPYFVSTGNITFFRNDMNSNLYYGLQYGYIHRDLITSVDMPYNILPLSIAGSNLESTYYADQITANRIYNFRSSFIGSNLYVSDNNGTTNSQLISLFATHFMAIATLPTDSEIIYAAFADLDGNAILKRIDFGDINNVEETDIALPNLGLIRKILIDATNKITIAIGMEVFSSIDAGNSWFNQSNGLESLRGNDIIFDLVQDPLDANRLALASSNGIFISEDGGDNWEQKTTSLVYNVAFSTETEGAMTASTYSSDLSDFYLHYSIDSGETWETINNEQLLGIVSVASTYYFNEDSVKVFVGTFDVGLIEFTIELNVLGVPEIDNGVDSMSFYPNPTSGIFSVSLKNSDVATVAIYSIAGSKVLEFEGISDVNISSLSSGIYMVRVQGTNNSIYFKRIVKH